MNYEAEITEIKKAVSELEKDMTEIKTSQPFLREMLKRNTEANEKLVETLHEVDKSMIAINDKLDTQSKDIASIKQEMDETQVKFDQKIYKVEERLHTVDDEGKLNIRIFFRNYFPWIVVLLGAGANLLAHYFAF